MACDDIRRQGIGFAFIEYLSNMRVKKTVPVVLVLVADLRDIIYDGPLAHTYLGELGCAMEPGWFQGWMKSDAEGTVGQPLRFIPNQGC